MTNIFAHEHLVGTTVHCKVRGNGKIIAPTTGGDYPVKVEFDTDIEYFTKEGKGFIQDKHPTLSFGHKNNYTHDYGTAPEKPIEYPALFNNNNEGSTLQVLFNSISQGTVTSSTKQWYLGETYDDWKICTDKNEWAQVPFCQLGQRG